MLCSAVSVETAPTSGDAMKDSLPARILRANRWTFLDWALAIVGLVSATVGVVATIAAGGWTQASNWWAAVAVLLGAAFLGRSIWQWWSQRHTVTEEKVTRRRWKYAGPYEGWQVLGAGRTHAVYSPALNKRLAADDPIAVEVGDRWEPSGHAAEYRKLQLQKLKLNEQKYRLATDLLPDSSSVRLEITDYAAFMATNRLAYMAAMNKKVGAEHLTFDMVEPALQESGKLPLLVNSRSSNHIGGDVLAVGDGYTYLQKQKNTAAMYPDCWVGSASGSFDLADLTPSNTLQDLVKTGLLRELTEEMGLAPEQVPSLAATKIVGYSRATYLGGKPQFYGVCRIGRLVPKGDQYTERFHRIDYDGGAAGLLAALERFTDRHEDEFSPPLEMLIKVVENWLLDDPDAERWLLPHTVR